MSRLPIHYLNRAAKDIRDSLARRDVLLGLLVLARNLRAACARLARILSCQLLIVEVMTAQKLWLRLMSD